MTELESIEKDYWWEIKSYLEDPTKERLVDLLEQVYDDGFAEGYQEGRDD